MIPYRIRRAVLADIPALNQIIVEAAQQLSAADYTQAQIDSVLKYGYGVDAQLIEDGTYFVAEMNGRILGSGGWSRHRSLHNGEPAGANGHAHRRAAVCQLWFCGAETV